MSASEMTAKQVGDVPFLPRSTEAGKKVSVVLAVAVHLVLAALLFYGVRWQTKAPEAVEVTLVRPETAEPVQEAPPPPPPEPEPMPKVEPVVEPKVEPRPPPVKPDIAIKAKEVPKPVPPKEAPKPFDPFQEQLKREADKLDARKVAETAAREVSQVKAAQSASARSKAMATYVGRIISAIRPRITLPPDLKGNPEAVFAVAQLPTGEILSVKLKKSSGNPVLDANIERAILKSSPLPKPDQSDLFSRDLELKFRPLDE